MLFVSEVMHAIQDRSRVFKVRGKQACKRLIYESDCVNSFVKRVKNLLQVIRMIMHRDSEDTQKHQCRRIDVVKVLSIALMVTL